MDKVLKDIKQALQLAGLRDGMTLSFHHHLRNGDFVLNQVLAAADQLGFRDLHVNASSLFDIHAPLIELIRRGVVTHLECNYMSARIGRELSLIHI